MTGRDALRRADPARHLPPHQLEARDEQLLREILATPTEHLSRTARTEHAKTSQRSATHRRQWWVTAATAATLLVVTLGVLQLTNHLRAAIANGGSPTSAVLQDPLREITDRSSEMYVSDSPKPILHVRDDHTRNFALGVPAGITSVRIYLVCTSGSTYAIRTDTSQSGTCRGSIGGYSDEATSQLRGSVTITVPADTAYVLLVIPTPTESSTPAPPIQLPLLDYPENAAPTGEPLIGRERGVGNSRVVGNMTKTTHSLFVVLTCRGSGTLMISTQDGFTEGSASKSPNTELCGPSNAIKTTYGDLEQGGMEHYGRMQYAIQPVGDVTWTVSFYDGR